MMASAPASAQGPWNQPGSWNHDESWRGAPSDPYQRIAFLQARLDQSVRQGALNPAEARRIDYRLDELRRGADNTRRRNHGYLSPNMVNYMNQRLDRIGRELRWRQNTAGGYDTPRDYR
jgi:hypothetical protein